ncbi:MAG: OmpH family outer membrane protein [Comamonas sp.]|jgi:outer membrane protein|uniref:OmpH family outer membrane protein n=1 Tax=Comamonas denitrificans TaxID=117506 RepID=UPI001B597929|nr:OmpH family outer membrane protein [Comamonas sp.]MCZ2107468.1 OmpH family outer membrane protein [Burkholderiales bacterium]HRL38330.1 OmpH family outer membrane protein [Comamonas denitrificans]MBP6292774.1 OmpH family outer membrane protein [Comamonas sp.]MBP7789791.1 OmpH family outer membrane protein [Comamonas sp.]
MKKFTRTIVAASLLAGLSFSAFADFKAGFVNTDRVFREANAAKTAQTRLEQEFSKREKELIALRDNLKRGSDAFERDAPTMSESQRVTKQRDLVEQDREFQRKSREFQEDLGNRKNEELAKVLDQANKIVQQVAEAEQYDVILQEAVYVNPKHDITDKVIKALNAAK